MTRGLGGPGIHALAFFFASAGRGGADFYHETHQIHERGTGLPSFVWFVYFVVPI